MNLNISVNESFKNFLWDTLLRSYDCRENLYEDSSVLSGVQQEQLIKSCFGELELWEKIYDQRVEYLKQNVTISDNLESMPAEKVEFHPRFGWTVSNGDAKAYLGKVSIVSGAKIEIGVRTYFSGPGLIRSDGLLDIGSYSCIAENVYINLRNDSHAMNYPSINGFRDRRMINDGLSLDLDFSDFWAEQKKDVSIGSDVWLGRNVRIYNGVNIGHGCVIGEGALVKKDCEPYGVYAGIPAKLIRYRFSEKVIGQLLELQWWNRPFEKIRKNKLFFSTELTEYDGDVYDLIEGQ